MADVRQKAGAPIADDFRSPNGSPIVLDVANNYAHFVNSTGGIVTLGPAAGVGLNTAQTNVTWTVNTSGISLNAGGYAGTGFTSATTAGTNIVGTNNTAGLSMGVPAMLTTAALSNHSHGNPTLNLTNLSGTTASNSAGFTLSLSAAAPGGGDAIRGIAANGSTASTNTVHFSNSNGVSFGFGAAGNSTVLTASHNAITTGRASTDAIGLNTAQSNVTWTVNSSGLSLDARGYAGTGTSATNASITLNSNGLAISVANPGGGPAAQSFYMWPDEVQNSSAWQVSGSTSHFQPIYVPFGISVSYIRFPVTLSCIGSMASIATSGLITRGMTMSSTINVGFYTQGTGASSLSLVAYATSSGTWIQQASHHASGTAGSVWGSGHTISYPFEGGYSNFTASGVTTLTNVAINSTQLTNFTNLRFIDIPFATSLPAGAYWFMYGSSTSGSSSGLSNYSTLRILASNFVATQLNQAINIMGVATNSSAHFRNGLGSWTTNAIGGISNSIALASISTSASNPIMMFQMIRQV